MNSSRTWFMALVAALGGFLFGFFGAMMVFHLFWVIFAVRETKGRALEEIA